MIARNLTADVLAALSDSPVVLLNGARQAGKSTLARGLAEGAHPARYLTLDDATVLAAARADPDGFVQALEGAVVLDEVQRAPELFRAIKAEVDRDRRPGRFLLTGSADALLLPNLSESLVGRMEILTLWPFSQGELDGRQEGFVDALFADELPALGVDEPTGQVGLWERVLRGGYPEVVGRAEAKRRRAWFNAYVTTLLQRDVRDLANIEGLTAMPRLLSLLAARASATLNYAEVSRSSGLPQTTLKRYMTLLETTFLIKTLPAWHGNLGKRLVKAPKLLLTDTGLAAHLVGLGEVPPQAGQALPGALLENFVAMEVAKQIAWSAHQPSLFHFRTQTGQEIDLVLEEAAGRLVGLEVKAGTSLSRRDFKGLETLAEARPEAFRRGVVLYGGAEVVGFAPRLHAVPLRALWTW